MKLLYFTATGNSLQVAKALGGELLSIPQLIKEGTYEFTDDKIGIIFPLYEWSVCSYVADFLKKATFHTDYLFAVATYGIFAGGVGSHLLALGAESGHSFAYVNKIKMVDNYLPGFSMKQQIATAYKKNIDAQITGVKTDIENGKQWLLPESALRKVMTNFMVNRAKKQEQSVSSKGIKKTVRVEDTCTQCGVCTKVCPVNNIRLTDGTIHFDNQCFSCYACIQNCPSNALHLKNERDNSRFRNSNVSLTELINANS